jgi:hypothetical protein
MRRNDYDVTATFRFPPDLFEALAQRAAEINAERTHDGLYDRDGAATFLCCSVSTIDNLRKSGKLKALEGTGKPLFEREALIACAKGKR